MFSCTAAELADMLRGRVDGDSSVLITGLAPADSARAGEITFAENAKYFSAAEQSDASAVLVSEPCSSQTKVLIRVANPRAALARLLPLFFPPDEAPQGIHPSAAVANSASIHPTAHIGPHCVIGARVRLGARTVLMGGNNLGADCEVGEDVCLFPNAVLYKGTRVGAVF